MRQRRSARAGHPHPRAWRRVEPDLDAIDNIELLGTVMGLSLRASSERPGTRFWPLRIWSDLRNLELRHYSSGMAARLAYAVAFRAVREVLILDEIFAVGDAGFKQRCEENTASCIDRARSMLLVSHNPRIVGQFCDRALLLEDGKMLLDGPGAQVGERYLSLLTDSERARAS